MADPLIIEVSGRRGVWAPWGDVQWVRNLRASGRATITVRRRKKDVRAIELDPTQRVAFFRDVLGPVARGSPFGVQFIRMPTGSISTVRWRRPKVAGSSNSIHFDEVRRPSRTGFSAKRAVDRDLVQGALEGSKVHQGASQTLEVTGITDELEASGRYQPLGPRLRNMDRQTSGDEIRRLTAAPDVMLGSVHAVTETGSLPAASMSGSQLAPYVAGAGRVILVVGTQKIVSDVEDGLRRIEGYALPLEDARALEA